MFCIKWCFRQNLDLVLFAFSQLLLMPLFGKCSVKMFSNCEYFQYSTKNNKNDDGEISNVSVNLFLEFNEMLLSLYFFASATSVKQFLLTHFQSINYMFIVYVYSLRNWLSLLFSFHFLLVRAHTYTRNVCFKVQLFQTSPSESMKIWCQNFLCKQHFPPEAF